MLDKFLSSNVVKEQIKSWSKSYLNSNVVTAIENHDGYAEPMIAAEALIYGFD